MNLRKYFLYCLSFSLVFAQSTAFGFVANNSNLNKVEYNTELNKYESHENNKPESHENHVKYSHTASGLIAIVKNEQIYCAVPINEELQTEVELNLAEIQKQNKAEFPTDTQIADNEQIQDLTVCPPELAQEFLDQGYGEWQYGFLSLPDFFLGASLTFLGFAMYNYFNSSKEKEKKDRIDRINEIADRVVDRITEMKDNSN